MPAHPHYLNRNCEITSRAPLPKWSPRPRGFTIIELLIVIAVIVVLASLLLPILSAARAKGQQTACLNNLKQLATGGLVYADDNGSKFADNLPLVDLPGISNNWALGNMQISNQSTNNGLLERGELFPYMIQPSLYRCPSDSSQTGGVLRVRSYAMNSWIGNNEMQMGMNAPALPFVKEAGYRTFVNENDTVFIGTSALWVIADEDQTTINDPWWLVTMDNSKPFQDFPANRHTRGYNLSFADSHVERWPLRDTNSVLTSYQNPYQFIRPQNSDWTRLKQATTRPLPPY